MKISEKTKIIIEGLVASLFIIILFMQYSNTISDEALKNNQELLMELSLRSAKVLHDQSKVDKKFLRGIAKNIGEGELSPSKKIVDVLKIMAEQTEFVRIAMISKEHKVYMNGNVYDGPPDDEILDRVLLGESVISGVFRSEIDGKLSTAILVPVYDKDNQVIGMVCGIKHIEKWSSIINYISQYDKIYFHVIDEKGNFVIRSNNENMVDQQHLLQEYFRQALFEDKISHAKVHSEIKEKKNGFATIKFAGKTNEDEESVVNETRYISFAPVGINNWHVVALIPEEFVVSQSEHINNLGKELLLKVAGIFFVLILIITWEMNNKTKSIALSKERYRIAVEKSDTIIFNYDIHRDIMYSSAQVEKNFSVPADKSLHIYNVCHQDDLVNLKSFVQKFSQKKKEMSIECQLKYRDGEYKWNKFSLVPIFDTDKSLIDAIGILEDITGLKEVEEKLLQAEQHSKVLQVKAERDHLTGLYNKGATEYLISKVLLENKVVARLQAFIIIDLDNFKAINDNFGHATGDEVLRNVAQCLKETFRNTDIVGRIGGDEFVIFLRDPGKMEIIISKMQEICDKLIFAYTKDDKEYKVSASVGGAIYPNHGEKFLELYNKADEALYNVKKSNKGQFKIYEGED